MLGKALPFVPNRVVALVLAFLGELVATIVRQGVATVVGMEGSQGTTADQALTLPLSKPSVKMSRTPETAVYRLER